MKKILLSLVFSISMIFSQTDQVDKWGEFQRLFNSLKDNYKLNEKISYSSNTNYKKILKAYYDVIALSPIEFKNNFKKLHKDWVSERKAGKKSIKPAILLRKFKETLAEVYSKSFVEIISSPYYLKVNINDVRKDYYESDGRKYPKIQLDCEILEILKGKNKFKKNQSVVINYIEWWLSESDLKFEAGKTYFIPVKQWGKNYSELGLYILPDNNFGVYPISNEVFERDLSFFELANYRQ